MGSDENTAHVLGNFLHVLAGAAHRDFLHQCLAVESTGTCNLFKVRMNLDKLGAVENTTIEADREERLDSAGTPGDDGDRAGGGNRGNGRIAPRHSAIVPVVVRIAEHRVAEVAKCTAFRGEVLARLARFRLDELCEA